MTFAPLRVLALSALGAVCALVAAPPAAAQTKLLRFPDIHGDRVVFTHAGDLWVAPAAGGTATRLTAHPGLELFAKFSPDGKWIAFTGQYDGDEQVYVMPSDGRRAAPAHVLPGARAAARPRWGYDNQVYGWTPDGTRILFRSHARRLGRSPITRLYTGRGGGRPGRAAADAGLGRRRPTRPTASGSSTRRCSATSARGSATRAAGRKDLFIFDLASHDATRITDHPRTDRDPMWIGDTIYFTSDRNGTFNLYAYDVATKTTTPRHVDARRGTCAGRARTTRRGASSTSSDGELQRARHEDAARQRRSPSRCPTTAWRAGPARVPVGDADRGLRAEPEGRARAVRGARRRLHRADREGADAQPDALLGRARQVAARGRPTAGRSPSSPTCRGEEELYVVAQDGTGKPERSRRAARRCATRPAWSPDGKRIAFADKDGRVYVRDGRRQDADADRRRRARGQIQRLHLVAATGITWRSRMNGNERLPLGLHLERGGRPGRAA